MFLYANNAEARINYARIMADHLERATAPMAAEGSVFWVTFILRQYTVREDEAASFEVKSLQRRVRRILQGCDFVGMVEAALFTNLDVVGAGSVRAVSWHTHALVWGVTPERIAKICDVINTQCQTVVPGITAAHVRPLSPGEVAGRAFYMCKGQISEYRVWPDKTTVPDVDTGQPIKQSTGRYWVRKRSIRTGDLARMCMVFKGRYLNELSFAGGAGSAMRRAINAEALAAYDRSQAAEKSKRPR